MIILICSVFGNEVPTNFWKSVDVLLALSSNVTFLVGLAGGIMSLLIDGYVNVS